MTRLAGTFMEMVMVERADRRTAELTMKCKVGTFLGIVQNYAA